MPLAPADARLGGVEGAGGVARYRLVLRVAQLVVGRDDRLDLVAEGRARRRPHVGEEVEEEEATLFAVMRLEEIVFAVVQRGRLEEIAVAVTVVATVVVAAFGWQKPFATHFLWQRAAT